MDPQYVEDVLKWEPQYPDALIGGGILYEESRAIVYGKYKSLKSMLVMHLALSIGDGRGWLGFSTPAGGASVLYLQTEMPHRFMKRRLDGMFKDWPGDGPARHKQVAIWSEPFIKLDTSEGLALLQRHMTAFKPRLLIVDPLYKVMSGNILDPNSVRNFLDSLDKTISQFKCSVLIVSHTRKGIMDDQGWGSDDLLGSVFLSAWADSVIKVTRKEARLGSHEVPITVNFDVLRHAEEPIDEMEVMFDSKSLLFNKVETGIIVQV